MFRAASATASSERSDAKTLAVGAATASAAATFPEPVQVSTIIGDGSSVTSRRAISAAARATISVSRRGISAPRRGHRAR